MKEDKEKNNMKKTYYLNKITIYITPTIMCKWISLKQA